MNDKIITINDIKNLFNNGGMKNIKYNVDIEIYRDFADVNIYGDDLNYAELGGTHNGLQCNNNNAKVKKLCTEIADKFRELISINSGNDIDVTTKTQSTNIQYANDSENKKQLNDFMVYLMIKGMLNTKYELPDKIIDQFLNPDKYDLISV